MKFSVSFHFSSPFSVQRVRCENDAVYDGAELAAVLERAQPSHSWQLSQHQ